MNTHPAYPEYLEYKRWADAFYSFPTASFEEWLEMCEENEANL